MFELSNATDRIRSPRHLTTAVKLAGVTAFVATLLPSTARADFDWGGQCEDGSGTFSQFIPRQDTIDVGIIPVGKANVRVNLSSSSDVDIQLYDVDSSTAIVHWPSGLIGNNASNGVSQCTPYGDVEVCYSGYNGDQAGNLGHEWIEVRGTTTRALMMKAYGYAAGDAAVDYAWSAPDDCDPGAGSGSFTTVVARNQIVRLGDIVGGLRNVRIALTATTDLDVQLYAGTTPLIKWSSQPSQAGILGQAAGPSGAYYGDLYLHYSGYNGNQTASGRGNEYVEIIGEVPEDLTMSVFGYAAGTARVEYAWGVDDLQSEADFVRQVRSRDVFDIMSKRDDTAGAMGLRTLKFLIVDVDSSTPKLYFENMQKWEYHYDLAASALGLYSTVRAFNQDTYWRDSRKNLAGSILAYDDFAVGAGSATGLYAVEYWPTDPVSPTLIARADALLRANMPIAEGRLAFHPNSETQQAIVDAHRSTLDAAGVVTVSSDELFSGLTYSPLNLGEGYGRLRRVGPGDPTPSYGDVVLYTYIPNDLSHVAGIITDSPQTPLSHINLKAKQNNTPNAYIRNAAEHPAIVPLLDQLVHYQVTPDGFVIEPATQDAVDAWLESVRPTAQQVPASDLTTYTAPVRLTQVGAGDLESIGAKAANVAELGPLFRTDTTVFVPDGYGIPFALYDQFMQLPRCADQRDLCADGDTGPSFYEQMQLLRLDATFRTDAAFREDALKAFRKRIEKADVPASMIDMLEETRRFFEGPGFTPGDDYTVNLRLRSSTNAEDLEGFNGAGLYTSKTHKPDEGDLAETVKEIWASTWNLRAYDEREFYRINHFRTYMGVLLHPSFGDEQVNGVAVTKNIYDANWTGFYVNAQYGEVSVTNPEPVWNLAGKTASVPDELLIAELPADENAPYEVQYIRHSNVEFIYQEAVRDAEGNKVKDEAGDTVLQGGQPVPTTNVLLNQEIADLRLAMKQIQTHFKSHYNGDAAFAMDIEFKVTYTQPYDATTGAQPPRGRLAIKQARPWVD